MARTTRDYRHGVGKQSQPYQRKSQTSPSQENSSEKSNATIWMAAIILSIVLLAGFFVVQHFAKNGVKSELVVAEKEVEDIVETASITVESLATEVAQAEKELTFTFYSELAQTEVEVDAEPISVELAKPYVILAGTFTTQARANQEQQRMLDQGFELEMIRITSSATGRLYYVLQTTPFTNRLELNKRRNELRAFGVSTQLRAVKPS